MTGVYAGVAALLAVALLAVATPVRAGECQPGLSGNDWTCINSGTLNDWLGVDSVPGTQTVMVINEVTGIVNGPAANTAIRASGANGGSGNMTAINRGTVNSLWLGITTWSDSGNATVINSGTVTTLVSLSDGLTAHSNSGSATVINSGTVNATDDGISASSNSGTATVINSGTVTAVYNGVQVGANTPFSTVINSGSLTTTHASRNAILGGIHSDLVINSGELNAPNSGLAIDTRAGDDTVIIEGGSVDGLIDGGDDTDSLAFSIVHGAEGFDRVVAALAAADPAGGSITINGETYTWSNFESLQNLLRMAMIGDGRANAFDFTANAALYCAGGGAQVYRIHEDGQGEWAYDVPDGLAAAALGQAIASGQHVLVTERLGVQLWALGETDAYGGAQFQLMGPGGYVYIFPANTCGLAD